MVKKILKIVGKILLIISLVLIALLLLWLVLGTVKSLLFGCEEFSILGETDKMLYGMDAVKEFLNVYLLFFVFFSILGIIPVILIPIFVFILSKFMKIINIYTFIGSIILLIISIGVHIYCSFNSGVFIMCVIPYFESIFLSFIFSSVFYFTLR